MQGDLTKIFFSYARADEKFALTLAKDLRSAGAILWLDQLDISPGDRWDRAVEAALKACPGMLVILSPASVVSNNVMDEVSFGLEENKKIVPVRYRPCDIPFRLKRLQYIDFSADYGNGLAQLLKVLNIIQPSQTRSLPEQVVETSRGQVVAAPGTVDSSDAPERLGKTKPPENPGLLSTWEKWRAKLISKSQREIALKVDLTIDHHVIEVRYYWITTEAPIIVKVDGEQVAERREAAFAEGIELSFQLCDGAQWYPAAIKLYPVTFLSLKLGIDRVHLSVAGHTLYEENA